MSEYNFDKIKGTLLYVCIAEPVKAYAKPGAPLKPDEWKASVAITDEDYVDALEDYARELDTKLSLKKVKSAEFEDIYKVPPPKGAGKNVWVLTLRKSVELGKTGKPVPDAYKPRVYMKQDGVVNEITNTHLVGNGSEGIIAVDRFDRTNGGSSLYLKSLMVTNLVEYVKASSGATAVAGSEWADDGSGGSVKVPAKAVAAASKSKKAVPALDEDDGDSPF